MAYTHLHGGGGGGGHKKKLSWGEGTCLTMGMNKSKTNDKQGK